MLRMSTYEPTTSSVETRVSSLQRRMESELKWMQRRIDQVEKRIAQSDDRADARYDSLSQSMMYLVVALIIAASFIMPRL